MKEWNGFKGHIWKHDIDTRDFILSNYTEYTGDDQFLEEPTDATNELWATLQELNEIQYERGGVYKMDTNIVSTITSHEPGYLNKDLEKIVGLQTDEPLKQAFMPFGGIKMANGALQANGYEADEHLTKVFTQWRRTHNQGVFDAYTPEMRSARKNKIITGLPDAYGRGRIIGDYRRIALYGIDFLIEKKKEDKENAGYRTMSDKIIRLREELSIQIEALGAIKEMAGSYGCDIGRPAATAQEAVQWLYFGYLAAIKDQNGAAMSIGRISAFLDIYIQRDLDLGIITEKEAQELIDHLVLKLRMVRFARTPEYNSLFSGYPIWATLSIGGMALDGQSMITKSDFRFLHTLTNMGPSPEPNLTVLYSENLPENFRSYASKIAIQSSSIQFENDNLLREKWGSDDCAIACCVSATVSGKDMQFFGARANLAKAVLYAINGGVDEKTGAQVSPPFQPITSEYIDYDEFIQKYKRILDWLAELYVNTLNIIHYMHDKYSYEAAELALMDSDLQRTFATGIAGISHAADSLSAIKYGKVKIKRDETGKAVDFETENDFPRYGNNDDRADSLVEWILEYFMKQIRRHDTYRDSVPTTSLLTITSNVVYGKNTGNLPDGRKAGEPLSPGANPSYEAEQSGLLASLNSTSKINYAYSQDGISNTQTINPTGLGKDEVTRTENLKNILDGYYKNRAYHLNVNVFDNSVLLDAIENPKKYPNLTIRVSGYAVKFIDLTEEQQRDVLMRTSHVKI